MGSHWSGADPESLDGCPHTQEQFGHRDHHTQRKGGCLQARERGPGQPLPHSPQRLRALPTPYVQTSSLQSCESNHFCCFETPFPAPAPPPHLLAQKRTEAAIDPRGWAPGGPAGVTVQKPPPTPTPDHPPGLLRGAGNSAPISLAQRVREPPVAAQPSSLSEAEGIQAARWGADKGRKQRHPSPEIAFWPHTSYSVTVSSPFFLSTNSVGMFVDRTRPSPGKTQPLPRCVPTAS